MSFLHWWPLGLGFIAIGAPLAVHFLTKPKPIPYRLSTIRFLTEVIEQRRARSRLRDWLILLLRMLCIGLLAFALARPILDSRPTVSVAGQKDAHRVLVIDQSMSMMASSGGVTSWSSAVASAMQYLDSAQGMQAAVVFAGAKARPVFSQMSLNLSALREAVKQAKPLAERCDPRAALEEAAKIIEKSKATQLELIILSDFQRSNWGTLLLDLIPQNTQIQFHSVATPDTTNIAIVDVRFSSEPVVGQPVTIEVEIANHSDREARVRCAVDLGDWKQTLESSILPQSTRTISETLTFPHEGWQHGVAKLQSNLDVLPADDEKLVAVRVRPPVGVVMVTRQHVKEIPSSSFYVQQALTVSLASNDLVDREGKRESPVQRIHPSQLVARNWPQADVYVLDHPGLLSQEILQTLGSQIRRGKGMLYVTSELVDASNLKQLAEILGSDFQPPVELIPSADAAHRKNLFVRKVQSRDGPFSVLGSSNVASLLKPVRFQGGLSTRATANGMSDQVLAELSDTSSLLYLSSVGAGQISVLNADLMQSNWSVQPTFLPVLSELMKSLLSRRGQSHLAPTGEALVRVLPSSITSEDELKPRTVEGTTPKDNDFGKWEWSSSQGSMVWSWPEPAGPGIYAIENASIPMWMIATNAPLSESELSHLSKEILTERVSGTRNVSFASSKDNEQPTDSLWNWLIVACTLGLVAEIVALRWNRM